MSFVKSNFIERCKSFRKKILDISQTVEALHIGGAFSCMEILDYIYFTHIIPSLKTNNINKFILSKGHSAIAQFVILNFYKIISDKELSMYCKPGGILGCHPDYGAQGIEASTGSLGHGMGLATGICQGNKIKKNKSKLFLVISDGELQEGSTWENMMMAANLELDNLICYLDHNGSQSFGHTKVTHPKFYPIKEKILSFNWNCFECDGHNSEEIHNVTNQVKVDGKKPTMIICNTTKGKGLSFAENDPIWHYRSPTPDEYKIGLKDLKQNKHEK
jgi:transketolase